MADPQPFVGLEPFTEESAPYFTAREIDARVIASNVLVLPVTVLHGGSGVGKSSLLNAALPGAIARMRRDDAPALIGLHRRWDDIDIARRWLQQQLAAAEAEPERPLILILDQFEEYFLYRQPSCEAFEADLAATLRSRTLDAHILISLREDGLYLLDQLSAHLPGLLTHRLELRQLDDEALRKAIREPIATFNELHPSSTPVTIEPGFTTALIEQLRKSMPDSGQHRLARDSEQLVELSYLQLTLQSLWRTIEQSADLTTLSRSLLDDLGGVAGIIQNHVRSTFKDLDDAECYIASLVFHYLVTPSGGKFAYDARDLADRAEENERRIDPDIIERLLKKLAKGEARVLRRTGDRFELFHDVLAKPVLDWRSDYLERGTFAFLTDSTTGDVHELQHMGRLFGRSPRIETPTALASRNVSRNHVLIFKTGLILDLRSRYGTTVNARPMVLAQADVYLESGDVICLANTAIMTFYWPTEAAAARTQPIDDRADGWGYLIDGAARRVTRLGGTPLTLAVDQDGALSVSADEDAKGFARLGHDPTQKYAALMVTDDAQPFIKVDRRDAYFNSEETLAKGDMVWLRLRGYHPELPEDVDRETATKAAEEAMSRVETAYRSLFRIGDIPFELIVDAERD